MKLSIFALFATIFYFTVVDIVPLLIRSSRGCLRPSPPNSFCETVTSSFKKLARSATSLSLRSSIVNAKRIQGLITAAMVTATNMPQVVGMKLTEGSVNLNLQKDEAKAEEKELIGEVNEKELDLRLDEGSSSDLLELELDTDHSSSSHNTESDISIESSLVGSSNNKNVIFTPSVLHYTDSPACIPSMADFTITNNFDHSIHLTEVISDNSQYYPVLFQPQSLAANSSLNIQLLFLPYHIETSQATLKIVSSEGEYAYKIIGRSTKNPYNLHPLSGFRVPAGVPHEQSIIMKNPHTEVLQVREIFTTEDFLSLKGTSGDSGSGTEKMSHDKVSEGQTKMWEIQPGEEKEVVVLTMSSSIPGSYNGYVHVKTDKDNIVLPIDLTVLKGGLFASPSNIDFGT